MMNIWTGPTLICSTSSNFAISRACASKEGQGGRREKILKRKNPQSLDIVTMLGRRNTDGGECRAMEKPVIILMEKDENE